MRRLTLETSTLQEIEEDIENFKRTCNKILKVDIRQELQRSRASCHQMATPLSVTIWQKKKIINGSLHSSTNATLCITSTCVLWQIRLNSPQTHSTYHVLEFWRRWYGLTLRRCSSSSLSLKLMVYVATRRQWSLLFTVYVRLQLESSWSNISERISTQPNVASPGEWPITNQENVSAKYELSRDFVATSVIDEQIGSAFNGQTIHSRRALRDALDVTGTAAAAAAATASMMSPAGRQASSHLSGQVRKQRDTYFFRVIWHSVLTHRVYSETPLQSLLRQLFFLHFIKHPLSYSLTDVLDVRWIKKTAQTGTAQMYAKLFVDYLNIFVKIYEKNRCILRFFST